MVGWLQAVPTDRTYVPKRLQAFLTDSEKVVRAQRDHPACLSTPIGLLFAGLIIVFYASQDAGADGAELLWQAWLILFAWAVYKFWDWSRRWFIVTDKRIIRASGTFRINIAQLMIALGRDITVQQNLLGEWLRYGTFKVESARDDHPMETVRWLAEPDDLYRAIAKTVQGAGTGTNSAVATMIGGDNEGGGVVVIDQASRNPTQVVGAVQTQETSRRRDRVKNARAFRALERIGSPPPAEPRIRAGQNASPGIIKSSRPEAHNRERAVQDFGYSDPAAGGSRRGLGLVKDLGLFRRRG